MYWFSTFPIKYLLDKYIENNFSFSVQQSVRMMVRRGFTPLRALAPHHTPTPLAHHRTPASFTLRGLQPFSSCPPAPPIQPGESVSSIVKKSLSWFVDARLNEIWPKNHSLATRWKHRKTSCWQASSYSIEADIIPVVLL